MALPDNQHALSGASDATVKLFNVNDGAVLRTFYHHSNVYTGAVTSLALLPDGLRFVSGSWDNTARIVEHGLARHLSVWIRKQCVPGKPHLLLAHDAPADCEYVPECELTRGHIVECQVCKKAFAISRKDAEMQCP